MMPGTRYARAFMAVVAVIVVATLVVGVFAAPVTP
jgi:hypothetical protein